MNRQAAKAMKVETKDLWEYFGLGGKGGSGFHHKRPFCPDAGPLSITAPKQLHYTQRHDGVYMQLDGLGCPELKREVVAMLDGIPWIIMSEAVEYVRYLDQEACKTFEMVTHRSAFRTKEAIRTEMELSREGMRYRLLKACQIIWEYLEQWLEKQVSVSGIS